MTVTGTAAFNLTLDEIIDQAYSRALGEDVVGYDLRSAAINLGLLLQTIQVRGQPLWAMEVTAITASMMIVDAGSYTLAADTVDVADVFTRDITLATPGDDLIVSRIPWTTYNMIPNKQDPGRSYQYLLDRQRDAPVMKLYPVVNVDSKYALYARRIRRLYDAASFPSAGGYTNYIDAPVRWLPTIISGLAWYLARGRRKQLGKEWIDDLHVDFEADYNQAAMEDSDSSPTRLEVDASSYFGR